MVTHMGPDEKMAILDEWESGKLTAKDLAFKYGRSVAAIKKLIRRYHPSTTLATRLIRANAERLALRVIRHATVEDAIDVLSRPNIDVLKPNSTNNRPLGIFSSVSLDSCGAVKVGVVVQEGGSDAAGSRSPVSNEARRPLGIPGPQSHRSQEHAVRREAHREGIQGGRDTQGNDAANEETLIVGPPVAKPRTCIRANLAKQVKESAPSRKAIYKAARGHNTHDVDSSIHLREDF